MTTRPVIALLTDFGLRDHYVGVMKAVIAGICPEAVLIDITHDIPAQDVRTAAFELESSWRYFTPGTVIVAVVDPDVGTERRAIGTRIGERFFVGPDNGLFDLVVAAQAPAEAVELGNPRYARAIISRTFEGRDRFAPAAAWLARGTPLAEFGARVDLAERLIWPAPAVSDTCVSGEVSHVDRFGNLVTNINRQIWSAVIDISDVRVGDHPPARLVRTYAEAREGELVALFGSSERLEVAVSGGSAAARLFVGRGAPVRVSRRA